MKGGSKMLEKIVALLLNSLLYLSQLNARASWVPVSLFSSGGINTVNRTCSIVIFKPLEKYMEAEQFLHLRDHRSFI